jgi:trehalose 6-phosphate synthase
VIAIATHEHTVPTEEFGQGHDFVVVANRSPVTRTDSGEWETSPGGLVAAVRPVMAGRRAAWVGWDGTYEPSHGAFQHDGMTLRSVPLSAEEKSLYYDGCCNGMFWPLYHDAIRPPEYRRDWWHSYVRVNRRFAAEAAAMLAPGGVVWVHDYQLQLVPQMLRQLRPDARIGFFLHIPFPPRELYMQLPWRREIMQGLLGADLIGLQDPAGVTNLVQLACRLLDCGGTDRSLWTGDRHVRVGAFPISIDTPHIEQQAGLTDVARRAASLRRRLGNPHTVMLGVDRLDYTKGIDVRLRAFQELLREGRLRPEECVFVQVATPTREDVPDYAVQKDSVERLVGEINGEFAQVGNPIVHYIHRSMGELELMALYRTADVMLVTPLRDGMNLVAKEYVAARLDDTGVLVLSEFAGAANELLQALLVNPYDVEGLKDTLVQAVNMAPEEARHRMEPMRRQVERHDVHLWSTTFLEALDSWIANQASSDTASATANPEKIDPRSQ